MIIIVRLVAIRVRTCNKTSIATLALLFRDSDWLKMGTSLIDPLAEMLQWWWQHTALSHDD